MPYKADIITIFVSSPSDVEQDRQTILREMHAWNQRNSRSKGCILSPLTWEDLVAPDIGRSAQEVINAQVGDDYDVFLGLMWSRFGTPTANATSGTEEEFERAVKRRVSGEAVRISFFFKTADLPFAKINPDQLKKVVEFKAKLPERGCLYREYFDEKSLSSGLNILFDRIENDKDTYGTDAIASYDFSSDGVSVEPTKTVEAALSDSSERIEELGLFEIEDALEESTKKFVDSMTAWSEKTNILGKVTSEVTEGLADASKFGQPDKKIVKDLINKISRQLEDFARFSAREISVIDNALGDVFNAHANMIEISTDFQSSKEDIYQSRNSLEHLINSVNDAN